MGEAATEARPMAAMSAVEPRSLPHGNSSAVPTISSFTASQTTVTAGTPVTLSWTVSNDSYEYIDVVGPVHGGSETVTPAATTVYTLNSTNQYGRSTMSVTVNVQ